MDATKNTFNNRVKTLYDDWNRVFGVMYGDDEDATDFTEVSSKIREMYGISDAVEIDSKRYLFSMQTFFKIFLKLLVYSFLSQLVDPMFTTEQEITKDEIETKTEAGKRKILITEDVAQMFQAIIEDREPPKMEKVIDGYTGFLFYDDDGNPLVAMHWQHRFNRMVGRYNDIYRVQMPNITPHVCRHTYCSNMAKSGMNPKTLQYLMGHSDISVTMNVYTHISFDDAEEELKRMEEFRKAQAEIEKKNDAEAVSQKMFKVV